MSSCTFKVFNVPAEVTGSESDVALGKAMVDAWRSDGLFYILTNGQQQRITNKALAANRGFVRLSPQEKSQKLSDLSYSGYVGSGTEYTDGEVDYAEIFTVCKDLPLTDKRVKAGWPCHGPVPWPSKNYELAQKAFMGMVGSFGDRLLKLISLGLGMEIDTLSKIAEDGWHHMRVLHFPSKYSKQTEESARGIGAHTDYGMLVIAAQDEVGQALHVRPPIEGEKRNRNWLETESSAGMYNDVEPWNYVPPVKNTLTCFPGDSLQLLTNNILLSTPHKVKLADRDRYAIAYFHEPNFNAVLKPLNNPNSKDAIHYGTHFTNMFMRSYPDRVTTKLIEAEDRLKVLDSLRERAFSSQRSCA